MDESQSSAKPHRAESPTPSLVSMKSDHSRWAPPDFSGPPHTEVHQQRAGSPVPSCVSMKSDWSMHKPIHFKDGHHSTDPRFNKDLEMDVSQCSAKRHRPESPTPSLVSMKSDCSKWAPPDFSGLSHTEVHQQRAGSPVPSCVSMKSDWSMDKPIHFKDGHHSTDPRPESPTPSCVSVKSDWSKGMPPDFSEPRPPHTQSHRAESPTPSCVSMKSDTSKGKAPVFSEPGPSHTQYKDLMERRMKRPTVEERWVPPWDNDKVVEFLRLVGKETEVENFYTYKTENQQTLLKALDAKKGLFDGWKDKMRDKLPTKVFHKIERMREKTGYSEHGFGLLLFIHNLYAKHAAAAANINLMEMFPGLFHCVYKFTLNQGWDKRLTLKKFWPTSRPPQDSGASSSDGGASSQPPAPSKLPRERVKNSKRWSQKLKKLANPHEDDKVVKVGNIVMGKDAEFRIAEGSGDTRVILALKEDGTEVAVKRMTKENYEVLKNEKDFLRLLELDDPSIVRYVDFVEDDGGASSQPPAPSKLPREWHRTSKRWSQQLEKLANTQDDKVVRVGNVVMGKDDEFLIAGGSDGTEVFLGLRDDGTEVAVKRMTKKNYGVLKNEKYFLRLPELDDPSIVRYVDFVEDEHFGYLVLQLCEYTLEEYIKKGIEFPGGHLSEREIAQQVLTSLKILHHYRPTSDSPQDKPTPILHRDIKPQNVFIDVTRKVRLADFGISRRLPRGQTTYSTSSAGTKCWMAKETINEDGGDELVPYKRSADIQVAGMLLYYILSRGHHPFGTSARCEGNILDGKYNLDHVTDVLAKDLIERMINEDPKKRPRVEECLAHPYFWDNKRRVDFLEKVANEREIDKHYDNPEHEKLMVVWNQCAEEGQFSTWQDTIKGQLPQEVFEEMVKRRKKHPYQDDGFGLLRFTRNLQQHHAVAAANIHQMEMFPGLLLCVYKFTLDQHWNTRCTLEDYFSKHTIADVSSLAGAAAELSLQSP